MACIIGLGLGVDSWPHRWGGDLLAVLGREPARGLLGHGQHVAGDVDSFRKEVPQHLRESTPRPLSRFEIAPSTQSQAASIWIGDDLESDRSTLEEGHP